MKLVKPLVVATASLAILFTGACGHKHVSSQPQYVQQYDVECDAGDYAHHDDDCGYYDGNTWYYYSYAQPGHTTYAPYGWQPPSKAKSKFLSKHKTKTVTNPAYRSTPQQRQTKQNRTSTPKAVTPKSNTQNKVSTPRTVTRTYKR